MQTDFSDAANPDLSKILLAAIHQSFNSVVITDAGEGPDGHLIVYANDAFCHQTGYTFDELIGKNPRILQGALTNRDTISELKSCLKERRFFQGSTVNYKKDGRSYYVEWNISPISNEQGKLTNFVSVQHDISYRVATNSTQELLFRALNTTPDSIFITDRLGNITFVNDGVVEQTGYAATELLGHAPSMFQSGKHGKEFYRLMWSALTSGETFRSTFVNKRKNGTLYDSEQTITPILDNNGEISHFISINKDLTERVANENELVKAARYDSLTGLLSRGAGARELERSYFKLVQGSPVSVALVDVDKFKDINDTWGHLVGDEILRLIADALKTALRETDNVIRWGGDEFLIILDQSDLKGATDLAERCRMSIIHIEHASVKKITASIGVAQLKHNEELESFISRADKALYQAKKNGRNIVKTSD